MPIGSRLLLAAAVLIGASHAGNQAAAAATFPADVNGALAANGVLVVDPTGEEAPRRITPQESGKFDYSPVWSSDGRSIAYLRVDGGSRGTYSIRIASVDGTDREVYSTSARRLDSLTWSPDGSRFAFGAHEDGQVAHVYRIDADGTSLRRLTTLRGGGQPSWSPDGSRIAFIKVSDVFTMDPDGASTVQLTSKYCTHSDQEPTTECTYPDNYEEPTQYYARPHWHPAGDRLVVHVTEDTEDGFQDFVGTLQPGQDRPSKVPGTEGMCEGVYSPDGQRLAFASGCREGSSESFVSDVDGSDRSGSLGPLTGLDWQPCSTGECPEFPRPVECRGEAAVSSGSTVRVRVDLPSGPVSVTFFDVVGSGSFTADECAGGSGGGADGQIFAFYDLSKVGFSFSRAEVCLPYYEKAAADAGIDEDEIDLFHRQPDGTRKVITSRRDTEANIVCGVTTGFSPFQVGVGAVTRTIDHACPDGRVPSAGFSDVPAGSTHQRGIDCLVWWEIARGTTSSTYSPQRSITRAQMATFLANVIRASTAELPASSSNHFSDDDSDFHHDNINALAEAGIVRGTSPGSYSPSEAVSRAQMATFLIRTSTYITGATPSTDIDFFTDDNGDTHEHNINLVAATGVTAGIDAFTSYGPAPAVTRAQMATFLARTLDLLTSTAHATPPRT